MGLESPREVCQASLIPHGPTVFNCRAEIWVWCRGNLILTREFHGVGEWGNILEGRTRTDCTTQSASRCPAQKQLAQSASRSSRHVVDVQEVIAE